MRIGEIPELAHCVDDLGHLGIMELHVEPVDEAGSLWLPLVILEFTLPEARKPGRTSVQAHPWTLALRPTEDAAWAAGKAFLQGISATRQQVIRDHPWAETQSDAESARQQAKLRIFNRWRRRHELEDAEQQRLDFESEPFRVWARTVRAARVEAGWLQRHVAEQAGIAQPRLSLLERGQAHPTPDESERLAKVLKVAAFQEGEPLLSQSETENP